MKCSAILLVSINILFLVISVLLVTSGSIVQYIFGRYYYIIEDQNGVFVFPTLWITTGCFLIVVSIFGIVVSIGESTLLINMYAVLLSMVLILQVATAISGLMLGVCRSKEIVSDTLDALMNAYDYDTSFREAMDWTQMKYQCCGNKDPDNWSNYSKIFETSQMLEMNSTQNDTTPTSIDANPMPSSCCIRNSDYNNFRCDKYHPKGCFDSVQELASHNVMIASFSALGLALFELLGAVTAIAISKAIRRERDIETDYSQLGMKSSYR